MGRKLLEAIFPIRFPTIEVFLGKISKMNFLWRKREFSLSNLRFLISPDLKGVVISQMIDCTEIKLLEAIFPNIFGTIRVF